jgi:hypothetical protein
MTEKIGSFQETLLDMWRELPRSNDISEPLTLLARRLAPYLPLERMLIRPFDGTRPIVDTPAANGDAPPSPSKTETVPCDVGEASRLKAWLDDGKIVHNRSSMEKGSPWKLLFPETAGEILALFPAVHLSSSSIRSTLSSGESRPVSRWSSGSPGGS